MGKKFDSGRGFCLEWEYFNIFWRGYLLREECYEYCLV